MSGDSFVDTNILVYAHDLDAGDRHRRSRELVEALWESGEGMLSLQVLQEFYVTVTRKIPSPLPPARARALIEPYLTWHVEILPREAVLRASEIQERHKLSFRDAMIITAAEEAGAERLYTENLNDGQLVEGIRIVNPLE